MGQNVQHPVSILPLWRRAAGQPQARVAALAQGRGSRGAGDGGGTGDNSGAGDSRGAALGQQWL